MKKIFCYWLLLIGYCADAAAAQTNQLYGTLGDYSLTAQSRKAATLTLLWPNPRTVNNILIRQDPISTRSDTNGVFGFTNVQWGIYRLDIEGLTGTKFPLYVGTNTAGAVAIASLVTNSAALPPNDGTNYYTKAQVDALIAGLGGGSGTVSNVGPNLSLSSGTIYLGSWTNSLARTNDVTASTNNASIVRTNTTAYIKTNDTRTPLIHDQTRGLVLSGNDSAPNAAAAFAGNLVLGGGFNTNDALANATIAGGYSNNIIAQGFYGAIGGGIGNTVRDGACAIAGGSGNWAEGAFSFIGGGGGNLTAHEYSTIGGGAGNTSLGLYSYICGGQSNRVESDNAWALGNFVQSTNGPFSGVIGYGLGSNPPVVIDRDNNIFAGGGVYAVSFTGSGAGLTGLPAASLTGGIPDAVGFGSNVVFAPDASWNSRPASDAILKYNNTDHQFEFTTNFAAGGLTGLVPQSSGRYWNTNIAQGGIAYTGVMVKFQGAGSPELHLNDTTSKNPWITFNDNGTRRGYIQLSGNSSILEIVSQSSDSIALRPASSSVGIGSLVGTRTPQANLNLLQAGSANLCLERIGGSIPETNSWMFHISSEPQGTIGGNHYYVLPQGSLTLTTYGPLDGNHAQNYPAAFAITTSATNGVDFVPNFSIWPNGNVHIGRLQTNAIATYPTSSPADACLYVTNNMATVSHGWNVKPVNLFQLSSTEKGDVFKVGTNGTVSFGPTATNTFSDSGSAWNGLGATNSTLSFKQLSAIPTNDIARSDSSTTNWTLCNISGTPTLIATNVAAGGWLTKALWP